MMRNRAVFAAAMLAAFVTACGGSGEEPPVEQIVVREPGQAAERSAPTGEGGELDLVAAGEAAFAVCSGCHVVEPGAASTAGPNLHGVIGRPAGSVDDFSYSNALAGSDIVWDIATLDRFLANPAGYAPGTSMVAGGVSDGERRAAIVAYLRSLSE